MAVLFIIVAGLVVAVIIHARLTIHLGTVQHDAQQRHFCALQELDRVAHELTGRFAAADDQHGAVAVGGDIQSVGHAAKRRRVNEDDSEFFAALLHHLSKALAFQQDGGVGHVFCHRQDIAVGDVGLVDDIVQLGLACQIMHTAQQMAGGGQAVFPADLRLAEIAVNE